MLTTMRAPTAKRMTATTEHTALALIMKASRLTRLRMPDGFCPPFQCQSGIIANSTMHQANAMPIQSRTARAGGGRNRNALTTARI